MARKDHFTPGTQINHHQTTAFNENSLEGKEECARPQDEEEGQVEDALLPGHHDAAITAEGVPAWEFLPLPCHLLSYHHHRHDWRSWSKTGWLHKSRDRARLWNHVGNYCCHWVKHYQESWKKQRGGNVRQEERNATEISFPEDRKSNTAWRSGKGEVWIF